MEGFQHQKALIRALLAQMISRINARYTSAHNQHIYVFNGGRFSRLIRHVVIGPLQEGFGQT
jgi:hypothetical protein